LKKWNRKSQNCMRNWESKHLSGLIEATRLRGSKLRSSLDRQISQSQNQCQLTVKMKMKIPRARTVTLVDLKVTMVEMEENMWTHAVNFQFKNNALETKLPQTWNSEMVMEHKPLQLMVDYLLWVRESHMWDLCIKMKASLLLLLEKLKVESYLETIESNRELISQMYQLINSILLKEPQLQTECKEWDQAQLVWELKRMLTKLDVSNYNQLCLVKVLRLTSCWPPMIKIKMVNLNSIKARIKLGNQSV
jgi:hypothetical protein